MLADRPKTAAGYRPEWLDWARSLCLDLATSLGGFLEEDVTIVGGLVPPLLISEEGLEAGIDPHPGTMDVDAALSLALLDESRYSALSERLRQAGFSPGRTEEGNVTRQTWVVRTEGDYEMKLEFLIAPPSDEAKPGTLQDLEGDFAAWIMPGMQLSFADRERITLSGRTLRGEEVDEAHVWVAGPGAFVVLKALAFGERGFNKDAYDLYYVIRNFGEGIHDVAERLSALLDSPAAIDALEILRSRFQTIDSLGPMRAAAFLGREDDDALRADIGGFVMSLVEECDRRRT